MTEEEHGIFLSQANYFGNDAGEDGKGRCSSRRCYVFYSRYGASGAADHQDQTLKIPSYHPAFILVRPSATGENEVSP